MIRLPPTPTLFRYTTLFRSLIHVSEMSWTKRVKHPSQMLKVGDEVDVQVLEIESANRRSSLGMKQLEANPWVELKESYQLGRAHVRSPVRVKSPLPSSA